MSDYYDSAEGLQISRERALLELKLHNCEDIKLFYQELGKHKTYSAQSVLIWLGY
jgi:intein-encoded DNA endonuclease-like protein